MREYIELDLMEDMAVESKDSFSIEKLGSITGGF